MFQFPRFALKTLCIQVINNCFTPLLITPKCNNNKVSVGLPHSEIFGYSVYSRLAKASTKRPSRAWSDPEIVRLFLEQKSSFFLRKLFISTYLAIGTSFVLQLQKQHLFLNSNVTLPWQEGHAHSSEWMLFRASLHVTVDLIHCDFG